MNTRYAFSRHRLLPLSAIAASAMPYICLCHLLSTFIICYYATLMLLHIVGAASFQHYIISRWRTFSFDVDAMRQDIMSGAISYCHARATSEALSATERAPLGATRCPPPATPALYHFCRRRYADDATAKNIYDVGDIIATMLLMMSYRRGFNTLVEALRLMILFSAAFATYFIIALLLPPPLPRHTIP